MYSMVLMAALATSPVVPDCHRHACYGCRGCWGCHGCYGCYGCHGCWGGNYGCHGCWGGCYGVVVVPAQPAPPPPAKKMPEQASAAPARLVVELPADAKLFIDDAPTTSAAAVRTFVTPPLEPQKTFIYTLRVEAMRDGERVHETKTVQVTAGSTRRLSFTEMANAAKADGKAVATASR